MLSSYSRHLTTIVLPLRIRRHFTPLQICAFRTQVSLSAFHLESNGDNSQLLLQCLAQRRPQQARFLLDEIPHNGNNSIIRWTSMLSKYAREGFVNEAELLFHVMPNRNIVTWNAMLTAYVHSGRISQACQLFERMPERNVVSWTSILCGFSRAGMINEAKQIFDEMPERNVVSWNSMISGLVRNGELEEARRFFDRMPVRNEISWNVMIAGYAENSMMEEARILFNSMFGAANVVTWTSLIAGYCRVGNVEEAYEMFLRMPVRNIVSWTAMISGFAWNGLYEEALLLFAKMGETDNMRLNEETFISLFYACAGLEFSYLGRQLHGQLILNGLDWRDGDRKLSKSLVHMYSRFRMMHTAQYIFNKNLKNYDVASLNSLINGYVRSGLLDKARCLFESALVHDAVSWTSIISGYFHAGCVEEACFLFDQMPERDSISWTAMISGFVQNELFTEAIDLFSKMCILGIRPLDPTYSTLLGAVGSMAYLELGKQFHALISKTQSKFDIIMDNSLVSMYAKCGEINDAHRIFSEMTSRDVISWNSMIIGFSHHGLASKALKLFEMMLSTGIKPNSVTFLGLLSACSHAGMIHRGWYLFNSMTRDHSIRPNEEHYICMIDLLGRAGKIAEAEEFVRTLSFEPGVAVWGALLGVCSLDSRNAAIGERVAKRVLELDPLNAPAHVVLCNIYAAADQHTEEEMLRKEMGFKGVRKFPGCSWVLLKGRVHIFLSGDRSHPQNDEILSLLVGDYGQNY